MSLADEVRVSGGLDLYAVDLVGNLVLNLVKRSCKTPVGMAVEIS